MTTRHHTPITEVAPSPSVTDTTWRKPAGRTLSEADVRAIAAQAIYHVNQARQQQVIEARVERVISAVEKVVTEALEMPLADRPEADRKRIEGDLWTVAELVRNPAGRPASPFWRDYPAT